METYEIIGNLLIGLCCTLLTCSLIFVKDWLYYKMKYSKLNGEYTHHSIIDGSQYEGWITELTHVSGRCIRTKGIQGENDWEGVITMSQDIPEFGAGVYQHNNRKDCGIHEIQLSSNNNGEIFVYGRNTSHGQNNTFALIWRKVNPVPRHV